MSHGQSDPKTKPNLGVSLVAERSPQSEHQNITLRLQVDLDPVETMAVLAQSDGAITSFGT